MKVLLIGVGGGLHNAPSYPNTYAFATLQADGSIKVWGDSRSGGSDAPAGNEVLLIGVGAKVCLIRNTNLVVA
jgi:hypothetical protein